jgi:hypothetical protein
MIYLILRALTASAHPSLGGGFGPGKKIAGGYAFVSDDWVGDTPVESPDPLTTCSNGGHGTHVAGKCSD